MLRLLVAVLIGAGLFLTIPAQAEHATGRDEATCIYDLVAAKLQTTAWRHLTLEQRIYFHQYPLSGGVKTYTIYATSSTNTPSQYKIQATASWSPTPTGRCTFITGNDERMKIVNSANTRVYEWTRTDTALLDPDTFPWSFLETQCEVRTPAFLAERAYEAAPARPNEPPRPAFAVDRDGNLTLTRESLQVLAAHGVATIVEGAGVVALQRYTRPTGRTWRFLRRAGQVALAVDAASRVYIVVGEGRTPSYVPIADMSVSAATHVWDNWVPRVNTGVLHLPSRYVETFYQGNQRRPAP